MVTVTVRYYNMLRLHAKVETESLDLPDGTEVTEAVRRLVERHGPTFAEMLLTPSGELASHLVIFVNEKLVFPGGDAPGLNDGDDIKLFPAISGG